MKKKLIIPTVLILFVIANSIGQNSESHRLIYPEGISLSYGYSFYSVKDEFVSDEKYSGNASRITANWSNYHPSNAFRLGIDYLGSGKIQNNNISTQITEFTLYLDYLYPIKRSENPKKAYLFLGPSAELFVYSNDLQIAEPGAINMDQSIAVMLSGGIVSDLIVPISNKLQAEASARLSLLSLTLRSVDYVEENSLDVKLLTAFKGTNGSLTLGLRYFPVERVSLRIGYELQLFWLGEWNPVTSVSDNIVGTVGIHF